MCRSACCHFDRVGLKIPWWSPGMYCPYQTYAEQCRRGRIPANQIGKGLTDAGSDLLASRCIRASSPVKCQVDLLTKLLGRSTGVFAAKYF